MKTRRTIPCSLVGYAAANLLVTALLCGLVFLQMRTVAGTASTLQRTRALDLHNGILCGVPWLLEWGCL